MTCGFSVFNKCPMIVVVCQKCIFKLLYIIFVVVIVVGSVNIVIHEDNSVLIFVKCRCPLSENAFPPCVLLCDGVRISVAWVCVR